MGSGPPARTGPRTITQTAVRKRSVDIAGHRTSISVEEPFWEALQEIAGREGLSLNGLITRIDAQRSGNLSSAIRVYVLEAFRRG